MKNKFYVVEISVKKDNPEKEIPGIYAYDDMNTAIGTFHSKLGSAMKSDTFVSELVMVINDYGSVIKTEKYVAPVEPEPQPEEVVEPTEE